MVMTQDRCRTTDQNSVMIVSPTAKLLGLDIENFITT